MSAMLSLVSGNPSKRAKNGNEGEVEKVLHCCQEQSRSSAGVQVGEGLCAMPCSDSGLQALFPQAVGVKCTELLRTCQDILVSHVGLMVEAGPFHVSNPNPQPSAFTPLLCSKPLVISPSCLGWTHLHSQETHRKGYSGLLPLSLIFNYCIVPPQLHFSLRYCISQTPTSRSQDSNYHSHVIC